MNPKDHENEETPSTSTAENPKNILQKNWKYPRKFPHITKRVYGILLEPEMWRCLRKGKLVKDPIIDAWLQLMADTASKSGLNILAFQSCHYELLSQCEEKSMAHWLWRNDCWRRDVWLFPLVYGGHCNLLVIVPRSRIFLFLDGPHKAPPENLLKQMCQLMESVKGDLDWNQWTFYQPGDYPVQHRTSNNCVIHVCAWIYVICTGERLACLHEEMAKMRRVMAAKFYAAPEMERESLEKDCEEYEPQDRESLSTWQDVNGVQGIPGTSSSTLEFCASLVEGPCEYSSR